MGISRCTSGHTIFSTPPQCFCAVFYSIFGTLDAPSSGLSRSLKRSRRKTRRKGMIAPSTVVTRWNKAPVVIMTQQPAPRSRMRSAFPIFRSVHHAFRGSMGCTMSPRMKYIQKWEVARTVDTWCSRFSPRPARKSRGMCGNEVSNMAVTC